MILQRLADLGRNLRDENISTTQIQSSFYSSDTYAFYGEDISNKNLIERSMEDMRFSSFMTSLVVLDHNKKQLYTNPALVKAGIGLSGLSLPATEVSNWKISIVNNNVVDLVNNLFNYLRSIYTINANNLTEIFKYLYLNENKYLIPLLLKADQKIKEVFTNEELQLRIANDPEIKGWKKLIIDINTLLDVDEAFEKLKILDDIWWLDVYPLISDDLDININFDEI